jgi:pyruvate,water dikinase
VGVVIQFLVDADVAGVLFTRNPVDGADERVVEASWGVGETVVTGRVVPDRFRISRSGDILERTAG